MLRTVVRQTAVKSARVGGACPRVTVASGASRVCGAKKNVTRSLVAPARPYLQRSHFHASAAQYDEIVKVPSMAESITEGTLKQWLKQKGDHVEADEEVATIETDKIDVAVNAPKAGTITELLASEEDTVTVGQDLFKLEPGEGGASSSSSKSDQDEGGDKKDEKPSAEAAKSEPQAEKEAETPEQKKEAEEKSEQSKKEHEQKQAAEKKEESKPSKQEEQQPKRESSAPKEEQPQQQPKREAGSRNETRVKMSRMRQRIAERLKQSQNAAASLTTFNEIDMSSLMSMRSAYKDEILKKYGIKLGFMSAFARAACIALQEIPAANASIEGEPGQEQIVYREYVDLSVAVATPKGLVTPVVRNAEGMNFVEIEQEIANLGKKARDGKLSLEDMSGGSFTISNGGVFGSLYGTPIINLPQAAVLGMHTIKDRPVVIDGKIVIRPIMVVALTYDHRLLDGREAVTFLVRVKELIEDPRRMLLA